MTCHNMKFAKTPLMHIKSPYFIELGITRQGSNQARSVEVRGYGPEAREATLRPMSQVSLKMGGWRRDHIYDQSSAGGTAR